MKIQQISKWKDKKVKCSMCHKKCIPRYFGLPSYEEYEIAEIRKKVRQIIFDVQLWKEMTQYYCSEKCLMVEKI